MTVCCDLLDRDCKYSVTVCCDLLDMDCQLLSDNVLGQTTGTLAVGRLPCVTPENYAIMKIKIILTSQTVMF